MKRISFILLFILLAVPYLSVSAQTSNWNNLSVEGFRNFIQYCGKSNGQKFKMSDPINSIQVPEENTTIYMYKLSNDDYVSFAIDNEYKKISSIKPMSYISSLLYSLRGHLAEPKSFKVLLQCTIEYIVPEITDKDYDEWHHRLFRETNENSFYYEFGFTSMRAILYDSGANKYITQVLMEDKKYK